LDDEIAMLEAKMGFKDKKMKKKHDTQVNMHGLGVGFMEYLDSVDKLAKIDPNEYQARDGDYSFNDSDQEVAIDPAKLGGNASDD
jgi:hypothetical protein